VYIYMFIYAYIYLCNMCMCACVYVCMCVCACMLVCDSVWLRWLSGWGGVGGRVDGWVGGQSALV